jgi:hypothetical protein
MRNILIKTTGTLIYPECKILKAHFTKWRKYFNACAKIKLFGQKRKKARKPKEEQFSDLINQPKPNFTNKN